LPSALIYGSQEDHIKAEEKDGNHYPEDNIALDAFGTRLHSFLTGRDLLFVDDGKTFFLAGEVDLHLIGYVFGTDRQIDSRGQRIFFALCGVEGV